MKKKIIYSLILIAGISFFSAARQISGKQISGIPCDQAGPASGSKPVNAGEAIPLEFILSPLHFFLFDN